MVQGLDHKPMCLSRGEVMHFTYLFFNLDQARLQYIYEPAHAGCTLTLSFVGSVNSRNAEITVRNVPGPRNVYIDF